MARTRRVLTRANDQFDETGEAWGTQNSADLSIAAFTVVDLRSDANPDYQFQMVLSGGAIAVDSITIWRNGFISLGDATQEQIDWVASHDTGDDLFGFPGDFISAGFTDTQASVEYTFGEVDFDPPFDREQAPPILRITWQTADFNSFQIQLSENDFTMVDLTVADPTLDPGQIGFRIDGYSFDATAQPMPVFFFNDEYGGFFTGDDFANTIGGTARRDEIRGAGGFDHLLGNGGNDFLIGDAGNDLIDGGTGADFMFGGLGNDTYVVDNVGDSVLESADIVGGAGFETVSFGFDRVNSSVTFTLSADVETLVLTGSAAIDATGNAAANYLYGNAAANTLNGGGGADTMSGGAGNDLYIVNSAGDRVIETSAAGGTDRVNSLVSFTLGANLEQLVLTGTAAIDGTGNGLANAITGNAGANILNGGGGADTMTGGGGNDTYVVDNAGDAAIELSGGGTERVLSAVTYTIPTFVEHIRLTGSAATGAIGNGLSNVIEGNGAGNSLRGLAGNDQLFGRGGNDGLVGGTGADRYFFDTALNASSNVDRIFDFSVPDDSIHLARTIFAAIGADGTLAASAFRTGTAALDSSDRILHDAATGDIFYDADGNGAGAAILFARVSAGLALTNLDFVAYTG